MITFEMCNSLTRNCVKWKQSNVIKFLCQAKQNKLESKSSSGGGCTFRPADSIALDFVEFQYVCEYIWCLRKICRNIRKLLTLRHIHWSHNFIGYSIKSQLKLFFIVKPSVRRFHFHFANHILRTKFRSYKKFGIVDFEQDFKHDCKHDFNQFAGWSRPVQNSQLLSTWTEHMERTSGADSIQADNEHGAIFKSSFLLICWHFNLTFASKGWHGILAKHEQGKLQSAAQKNTLKSKGENFADEN